MQSNIPEKRTALESLTKEDRAFIENLSNKLEKRLQIDLSYYVITEKPINIKFYSPTLTIDNMIIKSIQVI